MFGSVIQHSISSVFINVAHCSKLCIRRWFGRDGTARKQFACLYIFHESIWINYFCFNNCYVALPPYSPHKKKSFGLQGLSNRLLGYCCWINENREWAILFPSWKKLQKLCILKIFFSLHFHVHHFPRKGNTLLGMYVQLCCHHTEANMELYRARPLSSLRQRPCLSAEMKYYEWKYFCSIKLHNEAEKWR